MFAKTINCDTKDASFMEIETLRFYGSKDGKPPHHVIEDCIHLGLPSGSAYMNLDDAVCLHKALERHIEMFKRKEFDREIGKEPPKGYANGRYDPPLNT